MGPYYERAKVTDVHLVDGLKVVSFADVLITDEGVDTASFLHASDDFVNMFDLLGNGVFGFVQTDLRNNIGGVRKRYDATTAQSTTLEKLVQCEVQESQRYATACLVRLIRGLLFTCQALQNMQRDRTSELHVCFRKSYDSVLKHHHSFIIRSVVTVAIRAVPHRYDFYNRITEGGSHEVFDIELEKWLEGLERIVQHMRTFLEQGGYGKV